jgi:Domain of unknown function (DUF4158)
MTTKNKLLSVLSDAEQEALYGLPDFDDGQRLEFLSLSETELALASSRPGLHTQVHCLLQIGYFKAKHAFFRRLIRWMGREGTSYHQCLYARLLQRIICYLPNQSPCLSTDRRWK